jgi:hypothetical protein
VNVGVWLFDANGYERAGMDVIMILIDEISHSKPKARNAERRKERVRIPG